MSEICKIRLMVCDSRKVTHHRRRRALAHPRTATPLPKQKWTLVEMKRRSAMLVHRLTVMTLRKMLATSRLQWKTKKAGLRVQRPKIELTRERAHTRESVKQWSDLRVATLSRTITKLR